jgi:hypothetical protein
MNHIIGAVVFVIVLIIWGLIGIGGLCNLAFQALLENEE